MRTNGDLLIPYSHPMADRALEEFLGIVKIKECAVDGYHLVIHYSKADYKDHFLETVQVYGKHCPFLPFNLVAKVGKAFLGGRHLMIVEKISEGTKVYCWNVAVNKEGKPLFLPQYTNESQELHYEGMDYFLLDASKVTIY